MHAPLTTPLVERARVSAAGKPRAAITGVGLLTPLGVSAEETWKSLLAGGAIRTHSRVPVEFGAGVPRVTGLAIRAAREAVGESGWTEEDLADARTALVYGTSKGPIEAWIRDVAPLPVVVFATNEMKGGFGLSETATGIAKELRMGFGPRLTLSAACATGLHAAIRGALLIQSGAADRVLVVASESSLHPIFIESFRRLGVIAKDVCRPFDQNRSGFLMSEAAAAICLEREDAHRVALRLSGPVFETGSGSDAVFIDRFAIGADPTHLTATDPRATTLRHLIGQVVGSGPVDFVHAHGTGTEINDATEITALEAALVEPASFIYSHKGALGHSLGASGLISIVLNRMVHTTGMAPRNIHTAAPMPCSIGKLNPPATSHNPCYVKFDTGVRNSLVMAAGFGGTAGVLSLVSS